MTAGAYDVVCEQGATFRRTITWSTKVLTGFTARMQVRQNAAATEVLADLTTENGHITIDGPTGVVVVEIPADETAAIAPGRYRYDLELADAAGVVTRLLEGKFRVVAEITR